MSTLIQNQFEIKPFVITRDNISSFEIMENRRILSPSQIQKIRMALVRGENPMGVIVINQKGNKMRLIDGNHRIEALRTYFNEEKKELKVEVILRVHKNLTAEEELEVYRDLARQRNQTSEDILTMYKDFIPFYALLQRGFPVPVTINDSTHSIRFKTLIVAVTSERLSKDGNMSMSNLSKETLLKKAQSMGVKEYTDLVDFMAFFLDTFGKVGKENLFCKSQYFIPLYDIYQKNKQYRQMPNFKERFLRVVGQPDIVQYANFTGIETTRLIRRNMIAHMNHHISKTPFV